MLDRSRDSVMAITLGYHSLLKHLKTLLIRLNQHEENDKKKKGNALKALS